MGRSVMTLADSITAYQTFEPSHFCEECEGFCEEHQDELTCDPYCDHSEDFQYLLDWIREEALNMFPSMSEADYWIGQELHVVAENAHSVVTVSEYFGMVSICLGSNYDRQEYWRDPSPGLGKHWREQVSEKFLGTFSELTKIGTFSNGESVYEKKGA